MSIYGGPRLGNVEWSSVGPEGDPFPPFAPGSRMMTRTGGVKWEGGCSALPSFHGSLHFYWVSA